MAQNIAYILIKKIEIRKVKEKKEGVVVDK